MDTVGIPFSCLLKTFSAFLIFLTFLLVLTVDFFWIFKTQLFVNVDKTFDKLWRVLNVGNSGPSDYSCYNSQTDKPNMDDCRQKFLDNISEC
uniref:Uncharacterized protein n=1 Tax=Glossina morsitans morsitans TaxID=37546 RepID=A0A1B0FB28_GLOMM